MPLTREVGARLAASLVGLSSIRKRLIALAADLMVVLTASYLLFALFLRQPILSGDLLISFILPAPLFVLPALHMAGTYDVMMRFWSSSQLFRVLLGTALGIVALGLLQMFSSSLLHYWNMLILQGWWYSCRWPGCVLPPAPCCGP
ncbi:hypothetical protein D0B54_15085 [Solimonas sp. K1W22B-7]|uniref:hypothetical protein n=1 Tax=Solimonas sp. K1W22B-7 TaxID=2303331 RepID=UPI000E330E55|nr:hypothetical protein [Solimonas sp. K1W22B-7]AXQ29921.1 hypothetical protein D0B54_15085 [Solimonas sp. K1W22B-7]